MRLFARGMALFLSGVELAGCGERVRALGGAFEIRSGRGDTTVLIRISAEKTSMGSEPSANQVAEFLQHDTRFVTSTLRRHVDARISDSPEEFHQIDLAPVPENSQTHTHCSIALKIRHPVPRFRITTVTATIEPLPFPKEQTHSGNIDATLDCHISGSLRHGTTWELLCFRPAARGPAQNPQPGDPTVPRNCSPNEPRRHSEAHD
jgi:hypothetical protein